MRTKQIKTYNSDEFMTKFMEDDPKVKRVMQKDFGKFFIADVQDLIKLSRVPVPPTRATTHSLIYLTKGNATMRIGFQTSKIQANMCLIVPAGQVFSYDKYEVNAGFICNFQSDFIVGKIGNLELLKDFEFLNVWGNPVIKIGAKHGKYLTQVFQRILAEYEQHGLTNSQLMQSYFIAALCEMNQFYKPLALHKNRNAVTLVNRFKDLLHRHIATKHAVSDYAALLNVTPNHLNKKVKEVTNMPTSKWIDHVMITEAKVLLAQTTNSISDVANALGILDQSYFSRLFKKYVGVTPLEFRSRIQKS